MAAPIDLHEVMERELEARSRYPWRLKACASTACLSAGAGATMQALERTVEAEDLALDVQLIPTGCMGLCSKGPLVRLLRRGGAETMYERVTPEVGIEIVRTHVGEHRTVDDHLLDAGIPFFSSQRRVVLANAGITNPDRVESYVAHGGYQALQKALTTMAPEEVVEAIRLSGLRGRGGAGYPAGSKWALLAAAGGDEKYVVANGDEGDPGAYMDRTVMEDDPHRVIEGIAIAAYATGAHHAYIYVRAEYPRAVERLDRAIRVARRNRLLGRRILDTDFDLEVEVRIGAGAFVCGEETALMASIEGRRGTPRLRPPYPTERGLWGSPTMINNVETLANVPAIVANGPEWFASIGTPGNTGHQGVRPRRGPGQHRPHRGPDGDHTAPHRRGHGRGHPRRQGLQGRPDRRPLRRVHPRRVPRHPGRLRHPARTRIDHGVGRTHRHGRGRAHARRRPVLHGVLHGRELREVHPVPGGDGAAPRPAGSHLRRERHPARSAPPRAAVPGGARHSLCGLGQTAPNPVLSTLHYFRDEYEALVADPEEAVRA
jgi:(2Fe-2S) ferredoxin